MVGDFTFGRLNSAASLPRHGRKEGITESRSARIGVRLAKKEKDDERALFSLY
jgi:hypothetical protein